MPIIKKRWPLIGIGKIKYIELYIRLDIDQSFRLNRQAGLGRAYFGAIAAVSTKIGVDFIFRIASGNGIFRAFWKAGIAHDAFIGNYKSQSDPPSLGSISPKPRSFFAI